jgi:hypothetical protein
MGRAFLVKKFMANISIFAIVFNILSTWLLTPNQVNAEYTPETWHTITNADWTMTWRSVLSTSTWTFDYLYTWNNQDKVNTVTWTKLDFSFELSDIYSWALVDYQYYTSTWTSPVASWSYVFTWWFNQFSNNIDLILHWSGNVIYLTLTWLVDWIYHIWVIPWVWETFWEYMTWNILDKVIDYEFIVVNNSLSWGGGGWSGWTVPMYQTWSISIIDDRTISLSWSLDFL